MDFLRDEHQGFEIEVVDKSPDRVIDTPNDVQQTEFDQSVVNSIEKSPAVMTRVEPYEGMEFDSADSAEKYYDEYARNKGFDMRIGKKIKSRKDGSIIAQHFLCNKEGFRAEKYQKRTDRVLPVPDQTRCGCNAIMVVSKRDECKWVVTRLVLGHNHEFTSPKSKKFLKRKREKSVHQLNLINLLDKSGVRPSKIMSVLATQAGGIDQVCLNESNVRNYLSNKRQKDLEKGDAQLMLTYFREQQSKNPGFFYAIQVDNEGRLANCFWADARSRMSYKFFGDVVTFDPTYLTNKFRMPFVPFTGVNHHHQSILFGCALLWDETEETFVWLLRTWLKAMFGQPPRTIITDQDQAITNAVEKVFSKSIVHHFCMWHILKKVPEVLGQVYRQNEGFKHEFNNCIHQTVTPDEFELAWANMIQKYKLETNSWLNKIYSVRESWIPAYLRKSFCAGMSTTQRSESMNSFFKDYVNSSTSMSTFVMQYEKALDARYEKEREKNFKTKNSTPLLKTKYPMELQAAQSYTRKIFRLFQEELVEAQKFDSEKIDSLDGVAKYKVHEFNKAKPVYIVDLNMELEEAVCTCHKFEFEGILCKHILMIFLKKRIRYLPSHYILNRWTISATRDNIAGISSEETKNDESNPSTVWFNSIMSNCIGLAEIASRSGNHYDLAIGGFKELLAKLNLLPTEGVNESNEDGLTNENSSFENGNQSLSCSQNESATLFDPPLVVSKGRPRSLRIKGHLEKTTKKTCSICKSKDHTKPTCPVHKSRFATTFEETCIPDAV